MQSPDGSETEPTEEVARLRHKLARRDKVIEALRGSLEGARSDMLEMDTELKAQEMELWRLRKQISVQQVRYFKARSY